MKELTVIIPNYNGMKFLPDCIDSLKTQTEDSFDILVVENGSSDGSLQYLKENDIGHLELSENRGFAGGVNEGLKAADTPYVLLLNNDTVAEPDFVEKLMKAIKAGNDIFAVSALMIKADSRELADSAGDGITILGWAYQRGVDEPVSNYTKSREVFSACGGAAVYRKQFLDETGYFDESHFAYLEDIDLSWRAQLAGYRIMFCPEARVYHLGSATSGSKYNSFKVRLAARNNIFVQYKNQPTVQLIINLPWLLLGILLKGMFFRRKGFSADYREGLREGLREYKQCRKSGKAKKGLLTYVRIEWTMLTGMAEYTVSFLKRHMKR